jgi:hypothetical protein
MRILLHLIIGFSILMGVILLNALIATQVTARLGVGDTVRTIINAIVLLSLFAMVIIVWDKIEKRRAARRRVEFLSRRLPLSNDDYFHELEVEDERGRRVARALRDAIAREIKLPPEMIRPSDALDTLMEDITHGVPLPLEPAREAIKAELKSDYDWLFENAETMERRGLFEVATFREFVEFYLKNLDHLIAPPETAKK